MNRKSRCDLSILLTDGAVTTAYRYDKGTPMVLDKSGGYGSAWEVLSLAWDDAPSDWLALVREQISDMAMIDPKAEVNQVTLVWPEGNHGDLQQAIEDLAGSNLKIRNKYRSQAIADYLKQEGLNRACLICWDKEAFNIYRLDSDGGCSKGISQMVLIKEAGLNHLKQKIRADLSDRYLSYRNQASLSPEDEAAMDDLCEHCLAYYFKHEQSGRNLKVAVNHVFPPFQLVVEQTSLAEAVQNFLNTVSDVISDMKDRQEAVLFLEGQAFRFPQVMALMGRYFEHGCHRKGQISLFGGFAARTSVQLRDYSEKTYGIGVHDGTRELVYPLLKAGEWLEQPSHGIAVMMEGQKAEVTLYEMSDSGQKRPVASEMIEDHLGRPVSRWWINLKWDRQRKPLLAADQAPV